MSTHIEQHLGSTFGSHQVTVTKTTLATNNPIEDSPYATILKPLDSNRKSLMGESKNFLNNQLYIEAFCEKENHEFAERTRKETA